MENKSKEKSKEVVYADRDLKYYKWSVVSKEGRLPELHLYDKENDILFVLSKVYAMSLHKFIPNYLDKMRIEQVKNLKKRYRERIDRQKELKKKARRRKNKQKERKKEVKEEKKKLKEKVKKLEKQLKKQHKLFMKTKKEKNDSKNKS